MGSAEFNDQYNILVISSHIVTYGGASNALITEQIREEIEIMWNEPEALLSFKNKQVLIKFEITAAHHPEIEPDEIIENIDPRNNYFRIEEYAMDNISFVDGLGCNTGYFKLENLYKGSTTAAHEYGHTLGLKHPIDLDFRGQGVPGIMYPRGTLVDSAYQYNPNGMAGDSSNGGTMHPMSRKVRQEDINLLKLEKLQFDAGKSIVGEFSSMWHPNHADLKEDGWV